MKELMLNDLVKMYSNDYDLGNAYRKGILESNGCLDEISINFPNDYDLGSEIRKIVIN